MGSFFGLDAAGQEAQGWPRELGAYDAKQYKDWLAKSQNYSNLSDFYTGGAADYWTQRRNDGFTDPGMITKTGQAISPWVQDYVQNSQGRRSQIKANEDGRPTAATVGGEMSGRLDTMGQNIGNAYTDMEGEVNDTSGRMMGRENGASEDVVNNIKDSSGAMTGAVNDTFGLLRGDNSKTYDGIKGSGKESFAKQAANLALIKPGGLAQSARVSRSFAPQVSDTLQRLKRMGIDPNSPEAAAALRNVETSRSRAMDDATAGATDSFISKSNDLESSQLGFQTAADRARLENEAGLATGQVDRSNKIAGQAATDFQKEKRTNANNLNQVDRDRSGRAAENLDTSFTRGQDLLTKRNQLSDWQRSAGMTDVDRANANIEGDNANEASNGALLNNQFDRGMAWQGADQSTKDNAASNLGQVANRYNNNMFQAANTAQGFGKQASDSYQTAYGYEAPQAGWGMKLLGGIASAGLNMVEPGTGTALSGVMGATGGFGTNATGYGGPSGGSGYGGGAGGGGNPYSFSAMPQQNYKMPGSGDWLSSVMGRLKGGAMPKAPTGSTGAGMSNADWY